MVTTVRAIYENGKIRLLDEVELKEGQELEIHVAEKLPSIPKKRVFGLHRGLMKMSDDFDEPLPDSFWFGDDE